VATKTFEQFGVLGLYTESPLHCGAESSVAGHVDLPIQRERHTEYPVIPGSTIKGVLRDECRDRGVNIDTTFGRGEVTKTKPKNDVDNPSSGGNGQGQDKEPSSGIPGSVAFGDGILVAFPVRSSLAPFHWVTCPFALERALRLLGESWSAGSPSDKVAWACTSQAAPVLLEELELIIEPKTEVAQALAILDQILPKGQGFDYTHQIFKSRLLVVSDDSFRLLVTTGTDAVTRIKLNYFGTTRTITKQEEIDEIRVLINGTPSGQKHDDNESQTLREPGPEELQGNMFVEELVPPETLYICPLRAADKPQDLTKAFARMPVIRLGGGETIGRGVTHLRYVENSRAGGDS